MADFSDATRAFNEGESRYRRDVLGQKPLVPIPPGDGWQSIATAPTTGPVVWVDVWNGKEVWRAHYACDRTGEEQPPFGPGWYYADGSIFREVYPRPTHWRAKEAVSQSAGQSSPIDAQTLFLLPFVADSAALHGTHTRVWFEPVLLIAALALAVIWLVGEFTGLISDAPDERSGGLG